MYHRGRGRRERRGGGESCIVGVSCGSWFVVVVVVVGVVEVVLCCCGCRGCVRRGCGGAGLCAVVMIVVVNGVVLKVSVL